MIDMDIHGQNSLRLTSLIQKKGLLQIHFSHCFKAIPTRTGWGIQPHHVTMPGAQTSPAPGKTNEVSGIKYDASSYVNLLITSCLCAFCRSLMDSCRSCLIYFRRLMIYTLDWVSEESKQKMPCGCLQTCPKSGWNVLKFIHFMKGWSSSLEYASIIVTIVAGVWETHHWINIWKKQFERSYCVMEIENLPP